MWRGYPAALAVYGLFMCSEWMGRGYKDNLYWEIHAYRDKHFRRGRRVDLPLWMGDEDFHLSHRSNLVRKLPEHYGPLYPGVPPDLPYVWPIMEEF